MAAEKRQPMLKVVKRMLDDFIELPTGMGMSEAKLKEWAGMLYKHRERERVGDQLLGCAVEFLRGHLSLAAQQLVALASVALSAREIQEGLAAAGTPSEDALNLMAKSRRATQTLSDGLSSPSDKKKKKPGVGLRNKS